MDKLIEKVSALIDQFAQEELGNRLSQFAMISLKNLILDEIRKYKRDDIPQKEKR